MAEKKEVLKEKGFMPWRWGDDNKLEGYLDADICRKIIGINEKCYVAILIEENEARFIRNNKFEEKVSGHENQIPIERIIFGKDKDKLYKEGRLILLEDIVNLDDVLKHLE